MKNSSSLDAIILRCFMREQKRPERLIRIEGNSLQWPFWVSPQEKSIRPVTLLGYEFGPAARVYYWSP